MSPRLFTRLSLALWTALLLATTVPATAPIAWMDARPMKVNRQNGTAGTTITPPAYLTQWGEPGTGPGQFSSPSGIAVDRDGYVYVVDNNNSRIQKFSSNGIYITQ